MGFFNKSKDDSLVDAVIFRAGKKVKGKYDEFHVMARGSGNKSNPNYGLKTKRVSRNVGLGLKKRYGTGESKDQYGSYGYTAKIPKRFF